MKTRLLRLGVIGAVWAGAMATAAEWGQYRGPGASGVDATTVLPTTWNSRTGENIRWKTPIPGLAHAAPIVWGERVYVATAVQGGDEDLKVGLYGNIDSAPNKEKAQWRLLALDRSSGSVLWNVVAHEAVPRVARHTKATHCNSTPATDGRRIVAIFGSEGLFCFNAADGALVWKKDLGPMDSGYFQVKTAQWGFASSPVIHDGKVVVQCDVQENSFLAVFDLETGKEIWRTARTDVPTWGTPTVVVAGGRTQIAVNGWHHSGGYDFATGKELWKYDGGGDIPVPTPVVAGDLIYFTSAHGRMRPMRAIRVDAAGGLTPDESGALKPGVAWNHDRRGNYMQTPLVTGGLVFGCADTGLLTCFDAKTGEVKFSEKLSPASEGYTASPVSDGRNLFFTSELGNVFVVPVAPTFAVAAKNELGETCLSTPAIAKGTLYFRTRGHLVAVGAK